MKEISQHDKRLAVVYRPINELQPAARNARTHSPQQIAQLAASIREFGWTNPILVDERGQIIAGHGRVDAARSLGMAEVATITLTGLSAAQKRAILLMDNKLALNAGWDEALLRIELTELKAEAFDISMIGFSTDEIADIFADRTAGLTDPDDTPAVEAVVVSKPGDLWLLGNHRLLCGDCTKAEDVARAMGDAKPHLMVTDPPYGVDYDPDWRNRALRKDGSPIGGKAIGLVTNDTQSDWSQAFSLFPGDVVYSWHPAGAKSVEFFHAIERVGFDVRMQIIWAKSHFPIGRGNYHVQHEPCWYAVRKGRTAHWVGDRSQTTLWQIDKPVKSETGHSTQKPVECMKRPIENNSRAGDAVYDPFLGSGTSAIACEQTGRMGVFLEISPQYVDVSCRRWMNFSGGEAVLEETGETFGEVDIRRSEIVASEPRGVPVDAL